MMTTKEKATELVDKFYSNIPLEGFKGTYKTFRNHAKQCALIAVDEILEAHFMKRDSGYKSYWMDVRKEIEKL